MNIKTKIQKSFVLVSILFLSASCVPFGATNNGGILKTTNGGGDWLASNNLKDANQGNLKNTSVAVLEFDPKNDQRIFMASYDGGLYRTENSGETWERILSKIAVYDLAVSPENSDVIYAAGFYADHGKALVSKDGGKSWEEIYNEAAKQNAVRAIAVNPLNSQEVIIGMTSGNIIKSTDGGLNWRLVKNFDDRVQRIRFYGNNLYALMQNKGLFLSSDAGESFNSITGSIVPESSGAFFSSGEPVGTISQFAVAENNSSVIYITTQSGVYKTSNGGGRWLKLAVPIKNQEVPFRAVAIPSGNDSIVFVSAGATIYKSLDGGSTFQTQGVSASGFVNYILVNGSLPQIAYAGIFLQ